MHRRAHMSPICFYFPSMATFETVYPWWSSLYLWWSSLYPWVIVWSKALHLQQHRPVLNLYESYINIYCIKPLRFQVYCATEGYLLTSLENLDLIELLGWQKRNCSFGPWILNHYQFSSVQSLGRVRLLRPMNHSTPGLPVHHQLLEFTQTQVHQVSDAIQPSHSLVSPSPAPKPSQHQGLFQWVNSSHEVAKVLEFQLQHQSFQWTPRTDLI